MHTITDETQLRQHLVEDHKIPHARVVPMTDSETRDVHRQDHSSYGKAQLGHDHRDAGSAAWILLAALPGIVLAVWFAAYVLGEISALVDQVTVQ